MVGLTLEQKADRDETKYRSYKCTDTVDLGITLGKLPTSLRGIDDDIRKVFDKACSLLSNLNNARESLALMSTYASKGGPETKDRIQDIMKDVTRFKKEFREAWTSKKEILANHPVAPKWFEQKSRVFEAAAHGTVMMAVALYCKLDDQVEQELQNVSIADSDRSSIKRVVKREEEERNLPQALLEELQPTQVCSAASEGEITESEEVETLRGRPEESEGGKTDDGGGAGEPAKQEPAKNVYQMLNPQFMSRFATGLAQRTKEAVQKGEALAQATRGTGTKGVRDKHIDDMVSFIDTNARDPRDHPRTSTPEKRGMNHTGQERGGMEQRGTDKRGMHYRGTDYRGRNRHPNVADLAGNTPFPGTRRRVPNVAEQTGSVQSTPFGGARRKVPTVPQPTGNIQNTPFAGTRRTIPNVAELQGNPPEMQAGGTNTNPPNNGVMLDMVKLLAAQVRQGFEKIAEEVEEIRVQKEKEEDRGGWKKIL